jgi:hypothetical protein
VRRSKHAHPPLLETEHPLQSGRRDVRREQVKQKQKGRERDDSETSRCKHVQNAAFIVWLGVNNLLIAGYWVEPSPSGPSALEPKRDRWRGTRVMTSMLMINYLIFFFLYVCGSNPFTYHIVLEEEKQRNKENHKALNADKQQRSWWIIKPPCHARTPRCARCKKPSELVDLPPLSLRVS